MAESRKLIDADVAIRRLAELKFNGEMQDYNDEIHMVFESVIETTPVISEAEIRAKAIDEFLEEVKNHATVAISYNRLVEIAKQFKGR